MPWTGAADQQALVDKVEYRADVVTAQTQTPAFDHELLYAEIEEASRVTLQKTPRHLVMLAAVDLPLVTVQDDGWRILLVPPADFLRFIRVKMDNWMHAVDDLLDSKTNRYRLNRNPFAGSLPNDPQAVLVPHPTGPNKRGIEVYPAIATDSVEMFIYIPVTAPELVPVELQDAMLWRATGIALDNVREAGSAQRAHDKADEVLRDLFVGMKGEETPLTTRG